LLIKFYEEIEAEIFFVDLILILLTKFKFELIFFLEMILKIVYKINEDIGSIKKLIIFKKIYDVLEFVLQNNLMETTTGNRDKKV
jgi:hypothetical protein